MADVKREIGWYWVVPENRSSWVIMYWSGNMFYGGNQWGPHGEDEIAEVDERRITRD